jgi:hypothetical protein
MSSAEKCADDADRGPVDNCGVSKTQRQLKQSAKQARVDRAKSAAEDAAMKLKKAKAKAKAKVAGGGRVRRKTTH